MQAAPDQGYQRQLGGLRRDRAALRLCQRDHAETASHRYRGIDDLKRARPGRRVLLDRCDRQVQVEQAARKQQQPRDDRRHAEARALRAEQLLERYRLFRAQRRRQHHIRHCTRHQQRRKIPYPRIAGPGQAGRNIKAVQHMQRAQHHAGYAQRHRQNRQCFCRFHLVPSS